jgi:uncharacterized secreted protein with C-terminal beta-propeller domain
VKINVNNSKWFIFSFLATILVISSIPAALFLTNSQPPETTENPELEIALNKFSSYEELVNFLETNVQGGYNSLGFRGETLESSDAWTSAAVPEAPVPTPEPMTPSEPESVGDSEHSKTNVQVEGVDEADIVKTDGEYIYIVSGNNLTIVKAYPPEEAQVVSKLTLDGGITGIFINGDKLAVFVNDYMLYAFYGGVTVVEDSVSINPDVADLPVKTVPENATDEENETRDPDDPVNGTVTPPSEPISPPIEPIPFVYEPPTTTVKVYDISNKANPVLTRDFTIDGSYFSSRMVGDYIYLVATMYTFYTETDVALPRITYENETETVGATDVYYYNFTDTSYTFTTVVALNIADDTQAPTHETIVMGGTSAIYVSTGNIYLTFPDYNWWQEDDTMKTTIQRVKIDQDSITFVASGEVPGYILNQFSMDEYNGYFRIATTLNNNNWRTFTQETASKNNLYVLDMNLNIVGSLENLAPGEQIYSTRFMGNRGYIVTFRNVDPLFVIDLSNPTAPTVLGELKVTGYSGYLHPYNENILIGIGKETIYDAEEDFAWYQGIKISLFDVSDVSNPVEIAKYEIGDRGTDSPILYEHKSLLFDREKNLLVIPVTVAEVDDSKYPEGVPDNAYGEYVWQGAYVFDISAAGINLKGRITHMEDNQDLLYRGYYFGYDYTVQRSLYIENVLYTISGMKVKMNSLDTLVELNTVELS